MNIRLNVYARPIPEPMEYEEFDEFKKARVNMKHKELIPENVLPTTTYWVMKDNIPIGYATLKHEMDMEKPGGHFGLCLKKEYQNQGIGSIVSQLLAEKAYYELGIEEVIFTSKEDNIQSQKSVEKIGGKLIGTRGGYRYYTYNLNDLFEGRGR